MKITNPNHLFEEPVQVAFIDPHDGRQLAGIGYKNEVICGCCGTRYAVKVLAKDGIIVLPWTDLVDEIIGG